MMASAYRTVDHQSAPKSDKEAWRSFRRQAHVASGAWTMFYTAGLCAGAPTVLIPQLQEEDQAIDDELSSWIYSVSNIMALPWVLIMPSFTRWSGRKPLYILTCIATLAVFTILYFSRTPYDVLTAGILQGFNNASNVTVMALMVNEYTSPKYRVVFLNIASASFFWGIWSSNAIGTFFHWKNIAILGIICSFYTFTVVFCPESPIWLAGKGKFKRSEEAFRWLHGCNEESNKELHDLIKSQMDYEDDMKNRKHQSYTESWRRKEFYKPLLLCILIGAQYNFSGKFVCSAYAIEVLSKMTGSKKAAHTAMLILDIVTILAMYFGSFLSRIMRRRTLFFTSAFTGVFYIFLISLHIYLVKASVVTENNIITVLLLVAYSLSISCGSVVMCVALYSEMIPLRYQTVSYMVISVCFIASTSVLLKLAPVSFKYLGMDGSFLFFGVTCGLFTVLLYLYLPETSNKTLLEIEQYFKDSKSETGNIDQKKNLVGSI